MMISGFWAVFKKDFNQFFSGTMGYMIMAFFLIFNGLLLWFLKNDSNILMVGFADMQGFFNSIPWLFILWVPAITMKSFTEEYVSGTIEILKTRPITAWQLILGKYFASFSVLIIGLVPTLVYAFSISQLAKPEQIDWGSIAGSYFGLLFLASVFTAIGIFTSILFKNYILSFFVALILNFLLFYGIEQLSIWYIHLPNGINRLGLYEHYSSIGKGVLDSRDFIYFSSVTFLFLWLTQHQYSKS